MKNKYEIVIILSIVISLISASLFSAETLIKIADDPKINYIKPEVKISPSGAIYIVYQADNIESGRSDIFLSKYEAGKVSFVKNLSNSSHHSYEPEIDIKGNGDIHVTWCDESHGKHYIKYRYFNGSTWSVTSTFGSINGSEIEDLRIKVDNSGNVFIVFMHWPAAKCVLISKYGNNVRFEGFPESGRSKHPDVDADSNNVHIAWQYRDGGGDYTIAYQKRANRLGSRWERLIDLKVYGPYGVQRPRMTLDSSNHPHINFFSKGSDSIRKMNYKYWNGSKFTGLKTLSAPGVYATYHFCDIYAANSNNMIVTMQKGGWGGGSGVHYNWKINGTWSGYSLFSKTVGNKPAKQSVDLDHNSLRAALAFTKKDDVVYLLIATSTGEVEPGAPIAIFTAKPQRGHTPLHVEFDASSSRSSNGTITNWSWKFGDGRTASGQTASHTYNNKGFYIVTLKITDSAGKTGTTQRTIEAIKTNTPPFAFFTYSPKSGIYPLNVKINPSRSVDSDGKIVKYKWDFGDGTRSNKTSNTSFWHNYHKIGNYTVKLHIYDNDGGSNAYSQSVLVYGVKPPVNVKTEIKENRTLFTIKYVTKITWDKNPLNMDRGVNIVKYKIYRKRKEETHFTFLAEVDASNERIFNDRIGLQKIEYDYKVIARDNGGRQSAN